MAVQFHVVASESRVERVDVTEDIERRIRLREEAKKANSLKISQAAAEVKPNGKSQ